MDKREDNLIPEAMINDLFLKLKQFFFLDGNYKKRLFILENVQSNLYNKLNNYYNSQYGEIYILSAAADLMRNFYKKNFYSFNPRPYIRALQIYSLLNNDYKSRHIKINKKFRAYLTRILNDNLSTLDIPSSYLRDYFKEGNARERRKIFETFNTVSTKYKLFINNLLSSIKFDYTNGLKEWIYNEDVLETSIFEPFPTLELGSELVDIKYLVEHKTIKNRLLKLLPKIVNGKEITTTEYPTLRNILQKSESLSHLHGSFSTRKLGLYLWDMCDNPLNPNKVNYTILVNELYNNNIRESQSKEDFRRNMLTYINITRECIKHGKFRPYTNP